MSGSLKMPIPTNVNPFANTRPEELRYNSEKRAAAVKMLMALYNEYPLRKGEEGLLDRRILLIQYAERGWFVMLKRECHGLSLPTDQLLAALTLLE